ncbi:hypothetical protein [Sphingomonas sp. ID0503]|uniref:hypothetical protein n=1 Tax=Sphingomonas sp. ID0503 TaxID=3399691 RepID=UPI003AFAEDBC
MTSPVQLPEWLRFDGGAGDLTAILPRLETYAALARHWREIATAVWKRGTDAPVDSPVRLAVYLAGAIDDPAVAEIFATLNLGDLHGRLTRIAGELTDAASPWAKLLRPMSDFVPAETPAGELGTFGLDTGGADGRIELKIPKLEADAVRTVGSAALTFDIGAEAGLSCAAGAAWPFQTDGVVPGLLRLGANGQVRTRAGLSLPFGQVGSGTAHAGASASASAGWFFRPDDMAKPFAEVLLESLAAIPGPLDLTRITHAMHLAGLEGVTLGCDGAVDAGLGIVLGQNYDIPGIASGRIGLTAELSFRRNARWVLTLRRVEEGTRFVLSRDEASERNWGVGVGLMLDATPLARRTHDLLLKADSAAKPIIGRIRPFLSPGTYLTSEARDLLKAAAQSIFRQEDLRDALVKDLSLALGEGEGDESALISLIETRIADLAATQAGGILADVSAWTGTVVQGLVAKVPALAATGLPEALTARIQPLLGEAKARFETLLAELVATPKASSALAKELEDIGVKVKATAGEADALLAGVRALVTTFEAFARKLVETVGDEANARLQARFGWSGADTMGQKYELAGTFARDAGPEAARLWQDLATGRLQGLQRMLADPSLAPAGVRLDPTSSLSRLVSSERGFAFEIVILGVELSIASIVKGKASITTNGAGEVIVAAEGSALRKVEGFDEGRAASFVSSWNLMLAKLGGPGSRRAMRVSVAFDHDDKALKQSEVKKLLAGLEAQKLIDGSRARAAEALYQQWKLANALDPDIQGRISLRMILPDAAVQRMVAIGRELNTPNNPALLAIFGLAVRAQLAAGVSSPKQFDRDVGAAKDIFTISIVTKDPVAYMVALWNSKIDLLPSRSEGQRLPAFAQLIPRAGAFVRLLRIMARIYDAIPVHGESRPGEWTEKDYAAAEKELASAARHWLRLNQKLILWFDAEMHPAMLAFLRLLALMTRPAAPGAAVTDGLDGDPDTATVNGLFVIAMAEGKGGVPIPV